MSFGEPPSNSNAFSAAAVAFGKECFGDKTVFANERRPVHAAEDQCVVRFYAATLRTTFHLGRKENGKLNLE